MLPHVWNLRSRRCFGAIARSFYAANGKFGLRLVRFNVLGWPFPIGSVARELFALHKSDGIFKQLLNYPLTDEVLLA